MNVPVDRLKHLRKPGDSSSEVVLEGDKQPYQAVLASKEIQKHLEIRLKSPDPAECPVNSMITNIRIEWHFGMAIRIIYGRNMVIDIKGKRLQSLLEPLKQCTLVWVAAYDPQWHTPPTDDTAPFIESIEIITEQHPEVPPPMSQRH